MEFQTVIEKRRSIRNFDPGREVSHKQIETLIRAASLAPSWKNQQTSRYYCILSPSRIEEFRQKCLSESNQKNCAGAPALIITTFKKESWDLTKLPVPRSMKQATAGATTIWDFRMKILSSKPLNLILALSLWASATSQQSGNISRFRRPKSLSL